MTKENYTALKTLLAKPQQITLVPHQNPDGDAIGACLALFFFLSQKQHHVKVIAPNNYPDCLKWMPGSEEVVFFEDNPKEATEFIENSKLIFTLDFNSFSRIGQMQQCLEKQKNSATFVMIDHHQSPDDYAKFCYSDVSMSSTCEMVYHFIENLQETASINKEIATCLYTGIMTDTGSFRFPATSSTTHQIIAKLIDKGAENSKIHQQTLDNNSYNRMQLLGVALNNLKIIPALHTAYITLSQKELDDHHFKKGDTEGFVNYGLSIKGVVFAAIFIENTHEGIVKISLRSKGNFDVNSFAREHFNGGGHINAAGGRSQKSLTETIAYFEKTIKNYKLLLTDEN